MNIEVKNPIETPEKEFSEELSNLSKEVNENNDTNPDLATKKEDYKKTLVFNDERYEIVPDANGIDECIFVRSKDRTSGLLIDIKDNSFYFYSEYPDNTILADVLKGDTAFRNHYGKDGKDSSNEASLAGEMKNMFGKGEIMKFFDENIDDSVKGKFNKEILMRMIKGDRYDDVFKTN